jgi:RHS repeat-associated protein
VFGIQLISQTKLDASSHLVPSFYLQDAHSGVRQLTAMPFAFGQQPAVTDVYGYDSFGTLIIGLHRTTGETPNTHRYRSEVWDSGLGLTYLRARYLNSSDGRFVGMDPYEGSLLEPLTFQDFVYGESDAIGKQDSSGQNAIFSILRYVGSRFAGIGAGLAAGVAVYEIGRSIAFDVAENAGDQERLDAYYRFLHTLIAIADRYWTGGQQSVTAKFPWLNPVHPNLVSGGSGMNGSLFSKHGDLQATNYFPTRWPELRQAIQYLMNNYTRMGSFGVDLYDDFHDISVDIKDGLLNGVKFTEASSNWSIFPGLNMTASIFRMKGTSDPYHALTILTHESMHDDYLGHDYINNIVGPYSQNADNAFGQLYNFLDGVIVDAGDNNLTAWEAIWRLEGPSVLLPL